MERTELIAEIVDREWRMFTSTRSLGGRASCQDDSVTFRVMRTSQMDAWADDTLESYLTDLRQAEARGRNLVE